jgi:hypothetical protein
MESYWKMRGVQTEFESVSETAFASVLMLMKTEILSETQDTNSIFTTSMVS